MRLRSKTLLVFVGLVAVFALLLWLATSLVLQRGFSAIEEEQARHGVRQASNELRADLDQLDRTLRDWAGGPPLGAVVGEDELATYAFPENFLDGVSISAGAVAVLIDAVGPFDHCPF